MDPTIILITAAILYVIYRFSSKSTSNKSRSNKKKSFVSAINADASKDYFTWPDSGNFDFDIVGESNYQAILKQLQNRHKDNPIVAYLIPENDNPFDKKAVRVDIEGCTVGYLERETARDFREKLLEKNLSNQVTKCQAVITGGHQVNGKKMHCGVRLDLELFDDEDDE